MKFSEIINKAIETQLSPDDPFGFSCIAVGDACDNIFQQIEVLRFLRKLGVNPIGENCFDEFPMGKERQQARALWLTWAAMIAEEEGK